MATKTFDVTGDVQKHIKSRVRGTSFKSSVLDEVDQSLQSTIKNNSEGSKQITGQSMPPLGVGYADRKQKLTGSSRPDLRYGFDDSDRKKDHALDMLYSQVDDQGGNFNIGYGFRSSADNEGKSADQYMLENQRGAGQRRGPRKWFPEEDISTTAGVQSITSTVSRLIEGHLNKGTITKNITLG
jgi:hypothetical protein